MKEFKGTKGIWTPVYSSGCCIGVGIEISEGYHEMVSNTILPETDQEYELTKDTIIADATLQAASPQLLEAAQFALRALESQGEEIYEMGMLRSAIDKALNY